MCIIWWYEPWQLLEPYKSSYANPPTPFCSQEPFTPGRETEVKTFHLQGTGKFINHDSSPWGKKNKSI